MLAYLDDGRREGAENLEDPVPAQDHLSAVGSGDLWVRTGCGRVSLHATATLAPRTKAMSQRGSTPRLNHRGIRFCAPAFIVAGAASCHTVRCIDNHADRRGVPHLDRPGAVRWRSQLWAL